MYNIIGQISDTNLMLDETVKNKTLTLKLQYVTYVLFNLYKL